MYTAVARRCTWSVHAVNGRLYGHIHGMYTTVHTGHKHGRLHSHKHGRVHGHGWTMYMARARPCTVCTRPCTVCIPPWAAVYRLCTAALGRVQTVYTAVHAPCTWSVRVPNTAGYAACTRPCTYRTHGRARAVYRVHGRLYGPCARPCTYHVQSRAWSVHDPNTAVYTIRTWPCTMYTAVLRPVYTAVHRPCTWSVHDPNTAVYGCAPCTQACLRPVYTAVYGP